MTLLPPHGDGSAAPDAVPSQSPGSSEPGLTATITPDAAPVAYPNPTPVAYPYTWEPEAKPKGVGVVAFIVAGVLLLSSLVASATTGTLIGPYVPLDGQADGTAVAANLENGGAGGLVLVVLAHVLVGTALGLWAIIQGIVSVATRRGRGYGVAAIIIAVVAPIVSYVAFAVAAGIAAAAGAA
ncbi:MAG: hypothetical protein ABWX82_11680 [Leifsonia sp.]